MVLLGECYGVYLLFLDLTSLALSLHMPTVYIHVLELIKLGQDSE